MSDVESDAELCHASSIANLKPTSNMIAWRSLNLVFQLRHLFTFEQKSDKISILG